jgi:hypothetical protein
MKLDLSRTSPGSSVLHITPLLRELIIEAVRLGRLRMKNRHECALRDLITLLVGTGILGSDLCGDDQGTPCDTGSPGDLNLLVSGCSVRRPSRFVTVSQVRLSLRFVIC